MFQWPCFSFSVIDHGPFASFFVLSSALLFSPLRYDCPLPTQTLRPLHLQTRSRSASFSSLRFFHTPPPHPSSASLRLLLLDHMSPPRFCESQATAVSEPQGPGVRRRAKRVNRALPPAQTRGVSRPPRSRRRWPSSSASNEHTARPSLPVLHTHYTTFLAFTTTHTKPCKHATAPVAANHKRGHQRRATIPASMHPERGAADAEIAIPTPKNNNDTRVARREDDDVTITHALASNGDQPLNGPRPSRPPPR